MTEAAYEIETTGETVGEAKWTALRELERRFPGLDKDSVEFVVLSEGERGLLGVGFVPARVVARVSETPPAQAPSAEGEQPLSPAAAEARELLERIRAGLGLDVSVSVRDVGETVLASFAGPDLGLVIGRHGQTIDALQYLANAVLARSMQERAEVVVDAAGYRDRRRAALEALADRTAERVHATGSAIALEPMTPSERKIVHLRLRDRPGIVTASEGADPNRHVVVRPAPPS